MDWVRADGGAALPAEPVGPRGHPAARPRVARRGARAPWPRSTHDGAAARGAGRPGDRRGSGSAARCPAADRHWCRRWWPSTPPRPATGSRSAAAATRRGRTCVSRLRVGSGPRGRLRPPRGEPPGRRHADRLPRRPSGAAGARRVVRRHRPRRHGLPRSTTTSSTSARRCARLGVSGATPPHELATQRPGGLPRGAGHGRRPPPRSRPAAGSATSGGRRGPCPPPAVERAQRVRDTGSLSP